MLGHNFGCTDNAGLAMGHRKAVENWITDTETVVWIGTGCRGAFVCNGVELTCGYSGWRDPSGRRNCSCSGRKVNGVPSVVPPDLASPQLVEAWSVGAPRYVPSHGEDAAKAAFVWWNLLDAVMVEEQQGLPVKNNYMTGYVRELQMRRMQQIVQQAARPEATRVTYCEIGTNGGHSSVAMLLADPRVHVHAFDLMMWPYSPRVVSLLSTAFAGRFEMHNGSSRVTVPAWTATSPHECDVLLVDGDHSEGGAHADLVNFKRAAAANATLVIDDINSAPGDALRTTEARGLVRLSEVYGPYDAPSPHNPCMRTPRGPMCMTWGFAVGRYGERGVGGRRGGAVKGRFG